MASPQHSTSFPHGLPRGSHSSRLERPQPSSNFTCTMTKSASSRPSRDSTPTQFDGSENTDARDEVDFTDDANWEDEPYYNLANPHEKSPPPLGPTPRPARKRKTAGRKVFIAQPTPTRRSLMSKSKGGSSEGSSRLINLDKEELRNAFNHGAYHSSKYAIDVLKTSLWLLRKPLSAIIFVYILAYLLAMASNAFRTVLSPVCWIPGVSRTLLCYTPPQLPQVPKWADYPKLAEMQGSTFEQLLDQSVGGSGLSLEIKKAEMATSDLVALVRVSDFKSKIMLAQHLEGFVEAAKKTGRGLQRLTSRVNGAVDSIIAVNDHALATIGEHINSKSILSIFNPFNMALTTHQVVARTFADSMSVFSTQMQRIIVEAEVSMQNLDRLEEMLVTLHEIVSREKGDISVAKEDLLAELWTILGGNKRKLRGFDNHLFLLRHIGEYRTRAMAHVAAAVQTLTAMSEDMEDLRERVAAPELIGEKVPVQVHMKAIHASLERLQADRIKAQKREEETYKMIAGVED